MIEAEREAGLKDGSLPKIHISGCMSSCGTHQIGEIGFHGSMKVIDKVAYSAFVLHINGSDLQGKEKMGEEVGIILEEDIPQFLVKLGQAVESEELNFFTVEFKTPRRNQGNRKRIYKIGHRDNGIFSNVCTTKEEKMSSDRRW